MYKNSDDSTRWPSLFVRWSKKETLGAGFKSLAVPYCPCLSYQIMTQMRYFSFVFFLLLSGGLLAQSAANLPDGITFDTQVEGISQYTLDNGLKVLLFPDPSKPTITVNVTYLVGSRHEGYGETGMAHLLEHMVFKGTPNHPNIPQELTAHGASPNGTTWLDRTNYFETFSATDENLAWALDMEADRMVNSYVKKEDLDSEMTVVRNEFERGENSPIRILWQRMVSTAYSWHNYGNSTIGARADLENVPIDRLQAFYKKYYQPDNAVLLVAGKIEPEKTLNMIAETFGKLERPTRKLIPTYTKEPTQDGERFVELRRTGDVQVVGAVYHMPPGTHSDYPAAAVLDELLTSQPGGRLYKAMVEPKLASSVFSFTPALREGGNMIIMAEVREERSLDSARTAMLMALDNFKQNPPSPEEVERARKRILKNLELGFNNSDRIGREMSEYIAQGDWRLYFLFRDNVEKVTPEDVITVAEKYLVPSNRTVGVFIPTDKPLRAEIPDAPDVMSLVKDYKGREAVAEGEAFDPAPKNIDLRTAKGEMPGGMETAFLAKKTRGNTVAGQVTLRFGDANSLKGKSTAASMVGGLLNKGVEGMDRQRIEDRLDELKARVRVRGGDRSATVSFETERENVPEVLELITKMLRTPTFPQEEFEKMKESRLASLEGNLSEPMALAQQKLQRTMRSYPKDDVRYTKTFEEQIADVKAVSMEDVKKFYQDFYGAQDATVSIVGDFDEKKAEAILSEGLDGWKAKMPYKRIGDKYRPTKAVNENIETPDKANAVFFAGVALPINQDHPDYAALVMGNQMMGGGFLNSRLATRIRQEEGLSYGVGSFMSADPIDQDGMWGAYAIYAPENAAALEKAFQEEVEKVRTAGFTQEELDAAREGWLQDQNVSRSQDNRLVGTLNNNLYLDRDMAWTQQFEDKISKLTVKDVNAAMKKYVRPDQMVIIKAGDFARVGKDDKP